MLKVVESVYEMVGSQIRDLDSDQKTEEIFHQMDKDNNGMISVKEFVEGAKLDLNIVKLLTEVDEKDKPTTYETLRRAISRDHS